MMRSRLAGVVLACLATYVLDANAVTIDFQSLEHIDSAQTDHGALITEDGFTLSGVNLYSYGTANTFYRGSTALGFVNEGTDVTLAASNGSAFNLTSIDLAEVNAGNVTVSFTGILSGGGQVTQSFQLDGNFSTGSGFQTFGFIGFTNVTSVVWRDGSPFHQFDNIVVSTVPLPAAAWLFASGILGLIGLGRRRRQT